MDESKRAEAPKEPQEEWPTDLHLVSAALGTLPFQLYLHPTF